MFGVTIAALLGPALVGLRVVLPHDLLLAQLPWSATGAADPVNVELRDLITQYYPVQHELVDRLRGGGDVMWLERVALGVPGITFVGWGALSPFLLPALVAPFDLAWSWSMALRLFVAMAGAYALTRSFGAGRAGATIAGVAFGLCGYMTGWLGWPQTHVGAFLPWVAWAARRCVAPQPAWWGVAALALATLGLWLGGFPAVSVYGLLGAGLVACHAAWQRRGEGWSAGGKGLAAAGLGVVVGTGLAAATLLPSYLFLDQLDLSHRTGLWRARVPPAGLLTFLVPGFFGDVVHQRWWLGGARLEQVGYAGVTTLALAVPAWLLRPRRSGVWFATALTVGLIALVYGMPPLPRLVASIPTLAMNPPTRTLALVGLWLGVLGGLGADALIRAVRGRARVDRRAGVILAGVAVVGAAVAAVTRPDNALRSLANETFDDAQRLRSAFETAVAETMVAVALLAATGLVVTVAVVLARRAPVRAGRVVAAGLVLVVAVDLVGFAAGWNVQVPRDGLFPDAPGLTAWREASHRHRVAGTNGVGEPNSHLEYDLREMRSHTNITTRHRAVLRRVDAAFYSPTRWGLDAQHSAGWAPWLSLLGVSTVLAPDWVDVLPAPLVPRPDEVPLGELTGGRTVTTTVEADDSTTVTGVQLRTGDFGRDPVGRLVVTVSTPDGQEVTGRRPVDGLVNAKSALVDVPDLDVEAGESVTVEVGATTLAGQPGITVFGMPRDDHPPSSGSSAGPSVGLVSEEDRRFASRDLGEVRVFTNPDALELVHAVPRARRVPSAADALDAVARLEPEQLGDVAVVEPAGSGLPDLPEGEAAEVTDWSRSGGKVTATVESNAGAVVLLLEEAFDGWSATVDGEPAPVVRANGLFVAAVVPAGEHTVGLSYRPAGLDTGLATTGVAALALVLVTGVAWRSHRAGGFPRAGGRSRAESQEARGRSRAKS